MKGYWITVALVVVTLLSTGWMLSHIHGELTAVAEGFDEIEAHLAAHRDDAAAQRLSALVEEWDKKRELWEMFLDHETMDEMENSLYALRGYVEQNAPLFLASGELERLRAMCTELDMQTRFSWGHLL